MHTKLNLFFSYESILCQFVNQRKNLAGKKGKAFLLYNDETNQKINRSNEMFAMCLRYEVLTELIKRTPQLIV